MNTNQIRLFDHNNHLVDNFEEEVEKVLISVHGDNYFDSDDELVNTNFIPLSTIINDEYQESSLDKTIEYVESFVKETKDILKKDKITIKDFIPVTLFILIFAVILVSGYYLINSIDLMSLIN